MQAGCSGSFMNPITDVCWKLYLPNYNYGSKVKSYFIHQIKKHQMTKPFCHCPEDKGVLGLGVGVPISFWEPFNTIEVVREAILYD